MVNEKQSNDATYWHPAFRAAIRLELEEYRDVLDFQFETPLNDEPLKVDAVIIKKKRDMVIKKNLAAIFRTDNIVEFKSPGDYLSINDFYKVYGYACIYKAITKDVSIEDISITLIESRHPRELLDHLEGVRKFTVDEVWPGIYHIDGDFVPIQIIETNRLEITENLWLSNLRIGLEKPRYKVVADAFLSRLKDPDVRAYLAAMINANPDIIEEVRKMDINPKLIEMLDKYGYTAQAEERKAEEIAKNALAKGASIQFTSEITGLDTQTVQRLSAQ
jgi:hypothetical protein